jgi:hypothetical protein
MKLRHRVCALILLAAAAALASDGNTSWKLRFERDDIRVYSNRVPGSPIDELKGECVLDAPLEVVAQVMLDVPSYTRWIADCVEARKFDCSDLTTCKLYFTLAMPWPVRDRDIVLQSTTEFLPSEGRIIGSVTALKEELVPKQKNRVRITSMRGTWIFEGINADTTRATFICWADPAGYVPAFIINMASVDVPFRTLRGLRNIVRDDAYKKAAENFRDEWRKFMTPGQ